MPKLKQSFLTIAIGLALAAGLSYAWTGPTATPPNNNASAPINVSALSQIKEGALQVNGFRNIGDSIFNGMAEFKSFIKIPTGAGPGKVLTSDEEGKANWEVSEAAFSYCATSWGGIKNFTNDAIMSIDFLRHSKGPKKGNYKVYDRIGHAYFDYTKWIKTDSWKNLTPEDKAFHEKRYTDYGGRIEDALVGCQCDSGYKTVWTGGCSWGDCVSPDIMPRPANEVYFSTCIKI